MGYDGGSKVATCWGKTSVSLPHLWHPHGSSWHRTTGRGLVLLETAILSHEVSGLGAAGYTPTYEMQQPFVFGSGEHFLYWGIFIGVGVLSWVFCPKILPWHCCIIVYLCIFFPLKTCYYVVQANLLSAVVLVWSPLPIYTYQCNATHVLAPLGWS